MSFRLFKNPYSRELQRSAALLDPNREIANRMMGGLMTATGATVAVSFAAAAAEAAAIARNEAIKLACSVTATVVGVSVAGVAGAAMLVPPTIEDISSQNDGWTQSVIVVDTGELVRPRSIVVRGTQGAPVEMVRRGDGCYEAVVNHNGNYRVEVTNHGGQMAAAEVIVEGLDNDIPQLSHYTADDERVTLFFTDGLSGMNWDTVIASDGTPPLEVNPEAGYAVFALPDSSLEIYVEDLAGNRAVSVIEVS